MDKIAVGPEAADAIDMTASPTENVRAVAEAKKMKVGDLTVVVLERDRHDALIAELRAAGARVNLIRDGDVAPSIAAAQAYTGVDMLMGVGGTPEGVISAAAIKCMGGAIQGKLWPRNDEERRRCSRRFRSRPRAHRGRSGYRATTCSSPRPVSRAGRCSAVCARAPRASRRSRS